MNSNVPGRRGLMGGLVVALLVGALAGCRSGDPTSRADYSGPEFGSTESRRAARIDEVRQGNSNLTEAQIAEKVNLEMTSGPMVTRRELERRAAQSRFEDELNDLRRRP